MIHNNDLKFHIEKKKGKDKDKQGTNSNGYETVRKLVQGTDNLYIRKNLRYSISVVNINTQNDFKKHNDSRSLVQTIQDSFIYHQQEKLHVPAARVKYL